MSGPASPGKAILIDGRPLPELLDERMIHDVVHGFYDKIRSDALLAPIFNGAIPAEEWPHHLSKMCQFWSSALLRTSTYEGRPLQPHLKIPGLDAHHFRRWLTLFRETVRGICPPEVSSLFMDRALRVAHSFRLAIAHNRGENTLGIRPILESDLRAD